MATGGIFSTPLTGRYAPSSVNYAAAAADSVLDALQFSLGDGGRNATRPKHTGKRKKRNDHLGGADENTPPAGAADQSQQQPPQKRRKRTPQGAFGTPVLTMPSHASTRGQRDPSVPPKNAVPGQPAYKNFKPQFYDDKYREYSMTPSPWAGTVGGSTGSIGGGAPPTTTSDLFHDHPGGAARSGGTSWIEGERALNLTSSDPDSSRVSFYVRIPINTRGTVKMPQPGELMFFKGVDNKHCVASGRVSRSYIWPKRATGFIELVEFSLEDRQSPPPLDPASPSPPPSSTAKLHKESRREYRQKMLEPRKRFGASYRRKSGPFGCGGVIGGGVGGVLL